MGNTLNYFYPASENFPFDVVRTENSEIFEISEDGRVKGEITRILRDLGLDK